MAAQLPNASKENWELVLAIMFVVEMISVFGFACIIPFLPLYVHARGTTTFMNESLCTALVYSGQALTMMIASPLWGYLTDRYGRKVMVLFLSRQGKGDFRLIAERKRIFFLGEHNAELPPFSSSRLKNKPISHLHREAYRPYSSLSKIVSPYQKEARNPFSALYTS